MIRDQIDIMELINQMRHSRKMAEEKLKDGLAHIDKPGDKLMATADILDAYALATTARIIADLIEEDITQRDSNATSITHNKTGHAVTLVLQMIQKYDYESMKRR